MVDIFVTKGMSLHDAHNTIETLSLYPDLFLEIMMQQELGMIEEDESPLKNGLVTLISFIIFGSTPIASYVISDVAMRDPYMGTKVNLAFVVSSICTGLTMFVLGAFTARFTNMSWWKSGLLIFANGAFAAGVAYGIGYGLSMLNVDH
eukprot:TRINITY_DN4783_c0_g1_i1.p2 TRINITY_DN4783_c0_g1~~TRINITY_DN4783_c0_g1_i1.p2  ORF type:complete len:148 (-),score=30.01 TRINITY_DN4783_c0_g1_i1:38-481(-)